MDSDSCSGRHRKRKCSICKELFLPDPRNLGRQKACSAPACQKARKALSQRGWLAKPENRDYFRGPEQVRRVQQWRRRNPGRRPARRPAKAPAVLQDASSSHPPDDKEVKASLTSTVLQDALLAQEVLITGLISFLTGSVLQDDIDFHRRRLIDQGRNVHGLRQPPPASIPPQTPSPIHDRKTTPSPRAPPARA